MTLMMYIKLINTPAINQANSAFIIWFINFIPTIIYLLNVNKFNLKKELSNIFNSYWESLNKEIKKTKDYQVREWQEAKKERTKSFKIVQHKLTGFFSNFPTIKGDK